MTRESSSGRGWQLARCRRGGMAIVVALLIVPIIGAVGLAIDLTRLWMVQSRLQTAVDAAVLVAGRSASAQADAKALFWSNFERTNRTTGDGYLGARAGDPVVTSDPAAGTAQVRASAVLGATLMSVLGQGPTTVQAVASARRTSGMELALVLDITGSMKANDNIGSLRSAATDLVETVFGPYDARPNLFMSVVPYVASVNIGKRHTDWLKPGTLDQTRYGKVGWAGCVEARDDGEDETDTNETDKPFTPFRWASTKGVYKSRSTTGTGEGNNIDQRGNHEEQSVAGDNDWSDVDITEDRQEGLPDNTAVGPNLSCPQTPILPLTTSKSDVLRTVNSLRATFRGGTAGNIGLQAGWFTLSPRWAGRWGKANSPSPYHTEDLEKVVVMMTDGNNEWYDYPERAPGRAKGQYIGDDKEDADYTAYGRLSDDRLMPGQRLSSKAAKTEIDKRTARLCTKMKQAGITIYTVVLGVNNDETKKLWRDCASKPEFNFNTSDKATLVAAFSTIGTRLASLRLSE